MASASQVRTQKRNLKIHEEYHNGMTQRELAVEYDLSRGQICNIIKYTQRRLDRGFYLTASDIYELGQKKRDQQPKDGWQGIPGYVCE